MHSNDFILAGLSLYEKISFPTLLITMEQLEATSLQYPILFERKRERPRDEVRMVAKSPSKQICSRCQKGGKITISRVKCLTLFSGHNARSCSLPANTMILPSDDVTVVATPKKLESFPKCSLLSRLGVDYLHQFARSVDFDLDLELSTMDPLKVNKLVVFINTILLEDKECTECISLSIFFFLLELQHLNVPGSEELADVSQNIKSKCSLPKDITWVGFMSLFY